MQLGVEIRGLGRTGWGQALVPLCGAARWCGLACVLATTALSAACAPLISFGGRNGQLDDAGPSQLTAEEAVDLARFRGWHVTEGTAYAPGADEVYIAAMSWDEAVAYLSRVRAPGRWVRGALDPGSAVFFVV